MTFLSAAIAANIAGKVGELKTPKETGSPEFKKRQAVEKANNKLHAA
jgi:hypothetical protein